MPRGSARAETELKKEVRPVSGASPGLIKELSCLVSSFLLQGQLCRQQGPRPAGAC